LQLIGFVFKRIRFIFLAINMMPLIVSKEIPLDEQELLHTRVLLANHRALNLWVAGLLSALGIVIAALIQDGTALFFVVVAIIVYVVSIPKTIRLRLDLKHKIKMLTIAKITQTEESGVITYYANFNGKTKEFQDVKQRKYAQYELVTIKVLKYSKEVIGIVEEKENEYANP
jgi:hypothetical protein